MRNVGVRQLTQWMLDAGCGSSAKGWCDVCDADGSLPLAPLRPIKPPRIFAPDKIQREMPTGGGSEDGWIENHGAPCEVMRDGPGSSTVEDHMHTLRRDAPRMGGM
ncbi:hypothetical protein IAS59_006530 [Cryptococcus gattii]